MSVLETKLNARSADFQANAAAMRALVDVSEQEAREVCAGCEVVEECRAAGRMEKFGVWGGLSERERRQYRRLTA